MRFRALRPAPRDTSKMNQAELQQRVDARNEEFARCYALDGSDVSRECVLGWLRREDDETDALLALVNECARKLGYTITDKADGNWTIADLYRVCHCGDLKPLAGAADFISDILDHLTDNFPVLLGRGRQVYKNNAADRKRGRICDQVMCRDLFLVALGNFLFEYFAPDDCASDYNARIVLDNGEERDCITISLDHDTKITDPYSGRICILPAGHYRLLETNFLTFKGKCRTVALPSPAFNNYYFIGGGSNLSPIRLNPLNLAATIVPDGTEMKKELAYNSTIHFARKIDDGTLLGFVVCGLTRYTHLLERNYRIVHADTGGCVADSDGQYSTTKVHNSEPKHHDTVNIVDSQPEKEDAGRDGLEIEYVCAAAPAGETSRAVGRLLLPYVILSYKDYCPTSIILHVRLSSNSSAHVSAHAAQFYSEFGLRLVLFQSLRAGAPSLANKDQRIIAALRDTGMTALWQKRAHLLKVYHLKYTPKQMCKLLPDLDEFYSPMRASTNEAGLVDFNKMFQLPLVTTTPYWWQYDNADEERKTKTKQPNCGVMFRHYPCAAEMIDMVLDTEKRMATPKASSGQQEQHEAAQGLPKRAVVAAKERLARMINENSTFMSGAAESLDYHPAAATAEDIIDLYEHREKTRGVQKPEHILQGFNDRPLVLKELARRAGSSVRKAPVLSAPNVKTTATQKHALSTTESTLHKKKRNRSQE